MKSTGAFSLLAIAGAVFSTLVTPRVRADMLEAGPGRTYATPCAAIAAAQPGDVITVAAGTYTDSCEIGVANLTLRGESGDRPKIDLSGTDHPASYKGIYVVTAADVTIENLELTGAHISDDNGGNAAGIRVEAPGLTVHGCNIHDNQNGILGGTTGTLTVEHSEFFHNGIGDGCNQGGCTHNLYIANIDTLYFRFNWTHGIATDTADKGHLLKSRAKANYILYNRITGEDGFDSYELNFPNGGLVVAIGNQIQKGPNAGNSNVLSWGEEGKTNTDDRVFLIHNTFVNDNDSGAFLNLAGAALTANDNLFAGGGSVGGGGALSADNWVGADAMFVDRASFDYRLADGSPALGKAVVVGKADDFSLTPVSEYAHPLGERVRAGAHDLGAFEQGTPLDGSLEDAAAPGEDRDATASSDRDAAAVTAGSSGGSITLDATIESNAGASAADPREPMAADSGCSCGVLGVRERRAPGLLGVTGLSLFACLLLRRRTRRLHAATHRMT